MFLPLCCPFVIGHGLHGGVVEVALGGQGSDSLLAWGSTLRSFKRFQSLQEPTSAHRRNQERDDPNCTVHFLRTQQCLSGPPLSFPPLSICFIALSHWQTIKHLATKTVCPPLSPAVSDPRVQYNVRTSARPTAKSLDLCDWCSRAFASLPLHISALLCPKWLSFKLFYDAGKRGRRHRRVKCRWR